MAPSCPGNRITIKDKAIDGWRCQECQTCPAGEGLSVKCGDVITSDTPIECRPCILGETYSGAKEVGACKTCNNCSEHQETIKACTLTSNAVCGKCKPHAYYEPPVESCVPCSACCNDGKDILIPECKVSAGVPANMRCSVARSEKCRVSKIAERSISATPTLLQTIPATTGTPRLITMYPTLTKTPTNKVNTAATSSYSIAIPIGSVGVFLVAFLVVFVLCYCKKRRNRKTKIGLPAEVNEYNQPAEEEQIRAETTELEQLMVAVPEEGSSQESPIEESRKCQEPFGKQETQQPDLNETKGLKPSQSYPDPPVYLLT